MLEIIDTNMVSQAFAIGATGFVAGVILPWAFWMIGSIVGVAQKFTR